MGDEQEHSPIPWTVHTSMKPDMQGEAYLRCHDKEDEILGDIVADVMKESDAHFIAMAIRRKGTATAIEPVVRDMLRAAYSQLNLCYHEEADNEVTIEVRNEIERVLDKYGYSVD